MGLLFFPMVFWNFHLHPQKRSSRDCFHVDVISNVLITSSIVSHQCPGPRPGRQSQVDPFSQRMALDAAQTSTIGRYVEHQGLFGAVRASLEQQGSMGIRVVHGLFELLSSIAHWRRTSCTVGCWTSVRFWLL